MLVGRRQLVEQAFTRRAYRRVVHLRLARAEAKQVVEAGKDGGRAEWRELCQKSGPRAAGAVTWDRLRQRRASAVRDAGLCSQQHRGAADWAKDGAWPELAHSALIHSRHAPVVAQVDALEMRQ